ncbi:uncharacterized homolog [Ambystoma mexicanum]|uniref:uncharacterized homolog n=1 Tax=Ambystoma mexicanum TaxID=8296 RepID=UPI0037E9C987
MNALLTGYRLLPHSGIHRRAVSTLGWPLRSFLEKGSPQLRTMASWSLHVVLLLLCGCCRLTVSAGPESSTQATAASTQLALQSTTDVGRSNATEPSTASAFTNISQSEITNATSTLHPSTPGVATSHSDMTSNSTEGSPPAGHNETSTQTLSTPHVNQTESSTQSSPLPPSPNSTSLTPKPSVSVTWTSGNHSVAPQQDPLSQKNPGLVAVLCIFAAILAIVVVVVAVKFCQRGGPQFQKLDEVPMNSVNEEAPFARYPPK